MGEEKCILLDTDARIPFREKRAFFEEKALGRSMGNTFCQLFQGVEGARLWEWDGAEVQSLDPFTESHKDSKSPESWNA